MPSGKKIIININDQPIPLPSPVTLMTALNDLDLLEKGGIAIALNEKVISKSLWQSQLLTEGDSILIITATQGG